MSEHAKKVELYEMNAPINLNIAKQREKNANLTEECMSYFIYTAWELRFFTQWRIQVVHPLLVAYPDSLPLTYR